MDNQHGYGPGYFAAYANPMVKGQVLRPNSINMFGDYGKIAEDRVRVDGLNGQIISAVALPE